MEMQKFKIPDQASPAIMKLDFSATFNLQDKKLRSEWNWETFKNTMRPIFIENKLLGIKVKNSRMSAFVSGFKHYLPPSGFRSRMFQSSFDDNELFEALSFVSQYCRVWKKTIVETTVPGVFLFNDISRSDLLFRRCMCPMSIRVGTRRKNEATTNASESKRYKFNEQETDFENFKKSVHHLFNPQILCFDSISTSCPFKSKYSQQGRFSRCVMNKKLLKVNFPPALREDFFKFTINYQNNTTASFPYKVAAISNPFALSIQKSKAVIPDHRLSYDEYLKMKSDELNDLRNQKYLRDKLAQNKKQNKKTLEQINDRKTIQCLYNRVPTQSDLKISRMENLVQDNVRLFLAEAEEDMERNSKLSRGQHNKNGISQMKLMPQVIRALKNEEECSFSKKGFKKYSRSPRSRCLSVIATSRTSRVTLTKEFYYCTPPVRALDLLVDDSERCFVNEFRVGHEIFGHVTFHGETNVIGMNLDDIIDFKLKEFNVYPDENLAQPVKIGEGLKRPATVVLFRVWPMDKFRTNFITDPEELARRKYGELLKRSCIRMSAIFLNYDPTLGHWSFKINC